MLRCSMLIFTIAICFVCTPVLLGQVEGRAGFPSELTQATDVSSSQTRQQPWLGANDQYHGALSTKTSQQESTFPASQYRLASHDDPFNEGDFYDNQSSTKQRLAQIDPRIRTEIEEQVRRDLEKKFTSQIQTMVKKQVRTQVRQAQQRLERAARAGNVRPVSSSTYRSPNRNNQPPTVTGKVLPLNTPRYSQEQGIEHSHSRYVVSDSRFKSTYRPPRQTVARRNQSSGQPKAQPQPSRESLPAESLPALRLALEEALSRLEEQQSLSSSSAGSAAQSTAAEALPMEATRTEVAPAEVAMTEVAPMDFEIENTQTATEEVAANEVANANTTPTQASTPPAVSYMLRTTVMGPEALLKDQSDSFEITVSNVSQQPATNIIVQLTVPSEITISQLDRDAYLDSKQRTVSWKVPNINAGEKEVIQYRAVSSAAGRYDQEITLGMENTFQGNTPFITVVEAGAPSIPLNVNGTQDPLEVAERLELNQ